MASMEVDGGGASVAVLTASQARFAEYLRRKEAGSQAVALESIPTADPKSVFKAPIEIGGLPSPGSMHGSRIVIQVSCLTSNFALYPSFAFSNEDAMSSRIQYLCFHLLMGGWWLQNTINDVHAKGVVTHKLKDGAHSSIRCWKTEYIVLRCFQGPLWVDKRIWLRVGMKLTSS